MGDGVLDFRMGDLQVAEEACGSKFLLGNWETMGHKGI